MRLLKLIIFSLLFVLLQLWSSNSELFKNDYNDKALNELMEKKQWKDPSEKQDIAYWLFWVLNEKSAPQDEIEYAAFQVIEIIEKDIADDSGSARDYYLMRLS